jgi:hypothetical protein
MRIVGNKLIARRNRNATLNFVLEYENGNPFVILSGWDNPYFVMTITSSRYAQEGRYMKSWWVSLEDQVKVEETTIEEVLGDELGVPDIDPADPMNANRKRFVKTGPKSFWYSDMVPSSEGPVADWISFNPTPINIVFTVQDTSEWIEQNYRWDCSIMVGTPTNAGQGKPPLKDFIVVKSLVEDAEMEVSSDSMGGLK